MQFFGEATEFGFVVGSVDALQAKMEGFLCGYGSSGFAWSNGERGGGLSFGPTGLDRASGDFAALLRGEIDISGEGALPTALLAKGDGGWIIAGDLTHGLIIPDQLSATTADIRCHRAERISTFRAGFLPILRRSV